MWLHRQNEYEWKYIGIWFDMIPEDIQKKIKSKLGQCDFSQLFIAFEKFQSVEEMATKNLQIRNKISAIQNHLKMSKEEINEGLEAIEEERIAKKNALRDAESFFC